MKFNGTNLAKVLSAHTLWVSHMKGGSRADLRGANLKEADLQEAYLKRVDLRGADLRGAKMQGANLEGADLQDADLREADLREADLEEANLRGADLREADLRETNLQRAILQWTDLRWTDMQNADLKRADLQNAFLQGAKNVPFIPMVCPDTGPFIGWKKAKNENGLDVIVKLLIPEDAKRSSATTRKCRASKAMVLEIQTLNGEPLAETVPAYSKFAIDFVYKVGEMVTPNLPFDEDRFNECSSGIHFFINRQEAVDY